MLRSVSGSRSKTISVRGRGRPATPLSDRRRSAPRCRAPRSAASRARPTRAPSARIVVGDVRQRRVAVDEDRNLRALELLPQVGLAAVDGDQIRLQREDALDVRIDERADALQLLDLRRIAIEAADGDDLRPAPIAKSISVTAGMREMIRRA